ncbi:MAG TPA: sugar phosphate isomerase/epimerase [Clostridia bacterium]|nr:sugar phosphate isomerase/epimerase [Clostridia bacterium]HXK71740.1 sugar phosphate isomerase/epimerase [Clostridia bacterium]
MSLPVAIQLYSVRNDLDSDFQNVIKKIKEYGYDGVEFASLHNQEPEYVKSLLDETGLIPVSAHVALDEMLESTDEVFKTYSFIGCKYIAVPYLPEERRPGKPLFDKALKQIEELGLKAKDYGLQLLYHNHDFEFVKVNGKFGLDVIYDTISKDLLKTEIDTCWVKVAGVDPSEYIEKYTNRSPVVHLKDFYKQDMAKDVKMYGLIGVNSDDKESKKDNQEAFSFRPLGMGMQDIPAILEASVKAGAQWMVVEQDKPQKGRTALECAKLSIKYLNNLIW